MDGPPVEHKPGAAEKEFYDFFTQTLGAVSLVIAILVCYLCSFNFDLAEELAFTNDEVLELSGPASRLLAKSKLPATTRRAIVSSGDVVGLCVAATAYVVRVLSLLQEKQGRYESHSQTQGISGTQTQQHTGEPAGWPGNGYHAGQLAGVGAFSVSQ